MKHSFQLIIGATAIASMLATAGTASAVNTAAEAKCHAAIAKNITKYQSSLAKAIAGCHKSRDAGDLSLATDCNTALGSDQKVKRTSNRDKAAAGIAKACSDVAPAADAVLLQYKACPSPVVGSVGTFAALSTCLLDLSEHYYEDVFGETVGLPSPVPPDTGPLDCHANLNKALGKAIKAIAKARTSCQNAVDKGLTGLDYTTACSGTTGDAGTDTAAALTALDLAYSTYCTNALIPDVTYTQWGLCAAKFQDPTAELQKACGLDKVAKPIIQGLIGATYELPGSASCTPIADVAINAAFGQKNTATRLDSGWTGLGHNVDVVDGYVGGVTVQSCDDDCSNCDVRIDTSYGNCRCENAPQTECSEIETADATNCGATSKCVGGADEGEVCATGATCDSTICGTNTCHCMFGPPLALNAGGVPVCVVNIFEEEFTGGTQEVGEYNVGSRARAVVYTGETQTKPCPRCNAGLCTDGVRTGKACSIDATHPDFGATSFDCPPDNGKNISGTGLHLALAFTSGTPTPIVAAIPTGSFCIDGPCHCSECVSDPSVACSNNGDCTAAGAGTVCGVGSPTIPPLDLPVQNQCDVGISECVAQTLLNSGPSFDPEMGLCNSGPFDQFCDGAVRQNGQGIIKCGDNTDCDTYNSGCPGLDCGDCTLFGQRSCFLPTVTATGTPGIFSSEGVSVFCSAATSNAGVNEAGGQPGPGRVRLDFDFALKCSDHSTQFQLPAGSNCP